MSMPIPEEKVNEVRQKASIVEVVSDFASLRKAGKNYLGLCPFHSERTPSFTVNEEKGMFHCFGCGVGGNVFTFVMRTSQITFPEAVKALAKRYGVVLPERELSEEEKRRRDLRARLFDLNDAAADYYHRILVSGKEGEEGRKYLEARGLSRETIEEFRLGFAPNSWDSLVRHLQGKGFPLKTAETVGLVIPRKEGSGFEGRPGYFDRFRRRVMFPIFQESGRVQAFGGRIVAEDTGESGVPAPKYMNSPETPLYSKGQTLYGLNVSKGAIREKGFAVIVEGYMDLLSLVQAGFRNVVASLGTALTPAKLALLGRFTPEAVLIFDGDESGQKAAQRSLEIFLQEGISARVGTLPAGQDPDSFVRKEKGPGFERILSEALPLVEYLFQQAVLRHDVRSVEGKVRIVRELLPALDRVADPLERTLYVERFAQRLGIKEAQITALIRGASPAVQDREPSARPRGPGYERILLQLMLLGPLAVTRVKEVIGTDGFSDLRHRKLAGKLVDLHNGGEDLDCRSILDRVDEDDLRDLISELLLEEGALVDPERMLEDCVRKMRISRVQGEIREVDEEIRRRSRDNNKEEPWEVQGLKELLKRKQRLIAEQKKWRDGAAGTISPEVKQ
ncbi:MAG TPA: DNA primase [Thermodesulfobacteriota bacterium]|nr:DNA primase [Thermodesulfobacteriota bacterium]